MCTPQGDWRIIPASAHLRRGRWAKKRLVISSLFQHLRKGAARQAGEIHFLSPGDHTPVLQHLSKLPNSSAASIQRRTARLTHSIFAGGFLSVVIFLFCENPDNLILLVTAFWSFSATGTASGFLMSAFIQATSQAGTKGNHWSNTIPPTSTTKRITHRTSGHLVQTTAWKGPGLPRHSLARGKRRQQQSC